MSRSAHVRAGFPVNPQHGPTSGRAVHPFRPIPNLCRRRPPYRADNLPPFVFIAAAAHNGGGSYCLQFKSQPVLARTPARSGQQSSRARPDRAIRGGVVGLYRPGPARRALRHPGDVLILAGTAALRPCCPAPRRAPATRRDRSGYRDASGPPCT